MTNQKTDDVVDPVEQGLVEDMRARSLLLERISEEQLSRLFRDIYQTMSYQQQEEMLIVLAGHVLHQNGDSPTSLFLQSGEAESARYHMGVFVCIGHSHIAAVKRVFDAMNSPRREIET